MLALPKKQMIGDDHDLCILFYASLASRKNLLDFPLLHWEHHCALKESAFEVAKEMHSSAHVIMNRHESAFLAVQNK